MKFKSVLLHLGHAKTGSTSLQKYLSTNKKILLEDNIVYPFSENENHNFIYSFASSKRPFFDVSSQVSLKQLVSSFCENTNSNDNILIISSESICSLKKKELDCLLEEIQLFTNQIIALIYCRNPLDYAASLIQTQVKNGVKSVTAGSGIVFKYNQLLKYFEGHKLISNLIVRDFSKNSLVFSDIIYDFFDTVHKATNHLHKPISLNRNRENSSLSHEGVVAANYLFHAIKDKSIMMNNQKVRCFLESIDGSMFQLPISYEKSIVDKARPQIEYLSNNFGIDYSACASDKFGDKSILIDDYPNIKKLVDTFMLQIDGKINSD